MTEDSTAAVLWHTLRVGELMNQMVKEIQDRSYEHDLSKTREPEKAAFAAGNERLRNVTYNSPEYKEGLRALGPALGHHYAANRHHPEHFAQGVAGMTLMDLVEMLADWKGATERHRDGSLARSLPTQRERFGIEPQLYAVLVNTAEHLGWIMPGSAAT